MTSMTMLDKLIQSLTIVFVLSLAVERVTAIFKRLDWQPLQRWKKSKGLRVALDSKLVTTGSGHPVVDPDTRDRALRQVNATNTLLVGVLLAFATRANALAPVIPLDGVEGWPRSFTQGFAWASWCLQVAMTGAAAGIGSSFWYDLLSLLIETRRARTELAQLQGGGRSPGAPGAPAPGGAGAGAGPGAAPAPGQGASLQQAGSAAAAFRSAAEAAARSALARTPDARVRLADAPGVPGLEVIVEVADPAAIAAVPPRVDVPLASGGVQPLAVAVLLRR